MDDSIAAFVFSSSPTLIDLVETYGSPLHVVWPHMMGQNLQAMRSALHGRGVDARVFYGAKVNKSQSLLRAAVAAGAGVDVSSTYELRDALRAGADPSDICATGPAKTAAFHAELIAKGALISVDSSQELSEIERAARTDAKRQVRILLRYRPTYAQGSRFGMDADELLECLHRLAGSTDRFAFEGFHFHLSGYGYESRVQALDELADLVRVARELGLRPGLVDIGGGLPVRYVDGTTYGQFLSAQCADHYRTSRVPESFYPYGGPIDACEWLDCFLRSSSRTGQSVAQFLRARNLALAIEPGRSLVDQAAISVFRVTRTKAVAGGHYAIFVEGSSFSACETWFSSEFLVDPVHVSAAAGRTVGHRPMQAFIAGHSCLDEDVLTNRLIAFASQPRPGDLLVYANTAGYQMDLLENEFHRHPMPRRICLVRQPSGAVTAFPDDRTE
jgi:diaminopimelate decarboxylase